MKKYVSLILLIVVLANTTLPVLGFTLAQGNIRKEMKKYIISKIPEHKLELIKVKLIELINGNSGLVFIHDNEFRYRGKMFDIVRKDTISDYACFYVVNDTLESKLIEKYSDYVRDNYGNEFNRIKTALIKLFKFFNVEYISNVNEICFENHRNELLSCFASILNIENPFDIPTPPPEFRY